MFLGLEALRACKQASRINEAFRRRTNTAWNAGHGVGRKGWTIHSDCHRRPVQRLHTILSIDNPAGRWRHEELAWLHVICNSTTIKVTHLSIPTFVSSFHTMVSPPSNKNVLGTRNVLSRNSTRTCFHTPDYIPLPRTITTYQDG
jgi:hypothetical protein